METDYIFQRIQGPAGIEIELVGGCEGRTGKVWLALARQVWTENTPEGAYRAIEHNEQGAPLLVADKPELCLQRISVSHCSGLLAVASLPALQSGEEALRAFVPEIALGVDVEPVDRAQVLRVREKFLSTRELEMVAEESVEENMLAWTCKEALLKAGMDPAVEICAALRIDRLPRPVAEGTRPCRDEDMGHGAVRGLPLRLASYRVKFPSVSGKGFFLTLAFR